MVPALQSIASTIAHHSFAIFQVVSLKHLGFCGQAEAKAAAEKAKAEAEAQARTTRTPARAPRARPEAQASAAVGQQVEVAAPSPRPSLPSDEPPHPRRPHREKRFRK